MPASRLASPFFRWFRRLPRTRRRSPRRRLRASPAFRLFAPLGALSLTACSPIGRVTVLPTVDTRGNMGAEARLTFALGLVTRFDHLRAPPHTNTAVIDLPATFAGGVRAHVPARGPTQSVLGFDGGIEYASVGSEPKDLGFRLGLVGSLRHYEPQPYWSYGAALQGAFLATVATGEHREVLGMRGSSSLALGPAVEAAAMNDADRAVSGRFGLGLSVEWHRFTEWTVR